jgi:dihydroneopterin aldolase
MQRDTSVQKGFIEIIPMGELISIQLKELRFFANHGLYPEEQKIGNEFDINLTVSFAPVSGLITGNTDTIDYTKLYELVKKEMNRPRQLLETLAMEITENIHLSFPLVKKIEISVRKIHVPIINFSGHTTVTFLKEY